MFPTPLKARSALCALAVIVVAVACLAAGLAADHAHLIAHHVAVHGPALALFAEGAVLVTKDRQANEYRSRANALLQEILDAKDLTLDDLKKKEDGAQVLLRKAQIAAGMTADEEVKRRGGDNHTALTRVGTPETRASDGELDLDGDVPDRIVTRMADGRKRILKRGAAKQEFVRQLVEKNFDGTYDYVQALTNPNARAMCTKEQVEAINKIIAITRGMVGPSSDNKYTEFLIPGMQDIMTRTIVGTTGDASGASNLLPLQQVPEIFHYDIQQIGLLQSARRYTVNGRTLRIPIALQTGVANTRPNAGIANISIVGEASTKPTAEPAFGQQLLTVYKYAAISQFGDETLADDFTGDLQPVVTSLVGGQILNRINEDITISGTNTSMPMGALNTANPSLLTVTRQTANTVTTQDVFKMYSRHTHGPQSFWLCSRRVVEALFALVLPAGSTGTSILSFLPDLRGVPQMRILGIPVFVTDLLQVSLGTQGDFNLVNPEFYALAMRRELTIESSIHAAFSQDVTTYRMLARAGGIAIPDGTYAYASSGTSSGVKVDPHSPFTQLV